MILGRVENHKLQYSFELSLIDVQCHPRPERSGMEAESSQAVSRARKRPAPLAESEDEGDSTPRKNGVKRQRSSSAASDDYDLDVLSDHEGDVRAVKKEKMARREANGDAGENGDEDEMDDEEEEIPARPIRRIGFRPAYQRGEDG